MAVPGEVCLAGPVTEGVAVGVEEEVGVDGLFTFVVVALGMNWVLGLPGFA